MAVVTFKYHDDLAESLGYATKERGAEDAASSLNCEVETAMEQFKNTKRVHDKMDGTQTFTLIQSFHPKERDMKTPEEFNELGRKLADRLFPGFETVIKTHTDKGHIHNHIVINTIHPETGVRILDKKEWGQLFGSPKNKAALAWPEVAAFAAVYNSSKSPDNYHKKMLNVIRLENDNIAREAGLSVIEGKRHERMANIPKDVMRMESVRKDSWVLQIMQHANHARGYSTSYDEFVGIMHETGGIDVRVENKNIVYSYSGKGKRVIRGKILGTNFDKEGLERNFAHNDRMFAAKPELRAERRGELDTLKSQRGSIVRDSSGVLLEPGGARTIFTKDYGAFTPTARRGRAPLAASELDLSNSIIPIGEIRKAKGSIIDYCKKNKIALTTDDKGRTVLKGRKHVVVTEFEVTNTRNKVPGNLIDFVAIHKGTTYLQAIAHINSNPRLLLLEQNFGERKRSFNAFYIPKQHQMERGGAAAHLTKFFKTFGGSDKAARGLLDANQAHVSKSGLIRIFAPDDGSAALEFEEGKNGSWTQRRQGQRARPLYKSKAKGNTVHVFADPKHFIAKHGEDVFFKRRELKGVLALLAPETEQVDLFLSEHKHVSKVSLVKSQKNPSKAELDFFGVLRGRYKHHGIEISFSESEIAMKREGPELNM